MPGGLFPDEAANGLDIISMEQGQLQPFYERGNGREALFFYMIWTMVKIFGFGVWQHHLTSALVGIVACVGTFFLTKVLFDTYEEKHKSTNIALLSFFLISTSSWHTVLSRTAFRANLIPLFATFTFYFLLKSWNSETVKKKLIYSTLFGATFALGFYTYIAYRILVPILFFAVFWPLLNYLWHNRRLSAIKLDWIKQLSLAIIAFTIFIFPLAHYFYTHPGSFIGRSGQVSVFNPELNKGNLTGTVLEVSKESFLAYFTIGDLNYRHNISGLPFLSPLVSPFFAFGLATSLLLALYYFLRPEKFRKYWPHFLIIGWFLGMLIPVITTAEGIPHGLRSIGTIPAVFIISAYGIIQVSELVKKLIRYKLELLQSYTKSLSIYKGETIRWWVCKSFGILLATLFFIGIPLETYANYFVIAYNDPANFYSFRSDLTIVSEYLKTYGNKKTTYLVLDKFSVQTPDYLTVIDPKHLDENPKNRPYTQVDPEQIQILEKLHNIKIGDQIVFTQSSIYDIKRFKEAYPNYRLTYEQRNKFGQVVIAVYVK